MLGLPGVRDAYRALVNLRFSRAMSLMLDGGVSLVDAFQLAGKATGDAAVSEACTREAEAIRHGVSPADALHNIPILREALPGWMRAAEATGRRGRVA
jgi:type II secretory pathway component PulF